MTLVCHSAERGHLITAPVRIGRRVTIGLMAVVFPGCVIGDGAVIAAGAVLSKGTRVGPGEIWAGVPARRVGRKRSAAGARRPGARGSPVCHRVTGRPPRPPRSVTPPSRRPGPLPTFGAGGRHDRGGDLRRGRDARRLGGPARARLAGGALPLRRGGPVPDGARADWKRAETSSSRRSCRRTGSTSSPLRSRRSAGGCTGRSISPRSRRSRRCGGSSRGCGRTASGSRSRRRRRRTSSRTTSGSLRSRGSSTPRRAPRTRSGRSPTPTCSRRCCGSSGDPPPERCRVVGDTPYDATAAVRAGIVPVGVALRRVPARAAPASRVRRPPPRSG